MTTNTLTLNIQDSDLLAPLSSINDSDEDVSSILAPVKPVPTKQAARPASVQDSLSLIEAASTCTEVQNFPAIPARPGAVHPEEGVSSWFREHGTAVTEGIRAALRGNVRTPADAEYLARVIAQLGAEEILRRISGELQTKANQKAEAIHAAWTGKVLTAFAGEVRSLEAADVLNATEFKHLLSLIADGMPNMARNLAGPDVDVLAIQAGAGQDWRALSGAWAAEATTRGSVVFAGKPARQSGSDVQVSYLIEVQAGAGWVLSEYDNDGWTPLQCSAEAMDRAISARRSRDSTRSQQARGKFFRLGLFRDDLQGV